MSWQLGAFTVLFGALAGGFAWYESSRPDARIVALVATLAAFAALGRIAFAAVPNVKPTTDIVLLSGYALGPAPGFVVGALAGLTSNFFFGQGPWTPWQMGAWGVTGLIGAGLAVATGRRIGRWPLALACMVVGFGFTAAQDVGDWVNYSDHSLAGLGVYVGKGVGFDAVHAAGCLVFALAFGPALARSLARFAARLHVTWQATPREIIVPVLLVAVTAAALTDQSVRGVGVARAAGASVARAAEGAGLTTYLLNAQNPDGGFGPAPGQPSAQLFAGWAALGLAAEGRNPSQVTRRGHSLIEYLRSGARAASDPGSIERAILAATTAGGDPRSFGGRDLVAALDADIGRDGSVSDQTNLTAFAVLALRAAGVTPRPRTMAWLLAQEDTDGGFNFGTAGGASDVDDTGAALEALAGNASTAAGRVRHRAVAFVEAHQDRDGGFPSSPGEAANAQSTSWAIQGLLAAEAGGGPVARGLVYLQSLTAPDGHVRYARSSDQTPVWVTAQAAMALARKPLPLAAVTPQHQARSKAGHQAEHGGPRGGRPGEDRRGRSAERARQAGGSGAAMRLATDAGILDALALAPIGVG